MKSIKFKELVIDDKYKDLKNINVQIVEVKIVKSRMELLLNLQSKEIINDDLYKSLYNFFREKFEDFNIKLHLRYDLNIQDDNNFRKYKEIINSIILDQIPSSRSWIKDLKYRIKDKTLFLTPPNSMVFFSLDRNGLITKLRDKISEELQFNFILTEFSEDTKTNNKFIEYKIDEERQISKDILLSTPVKSKDKISKIEPIKNYSIGRSISEETMPINEVSLQTGIATIKGEIFDLEYKEIRGNRLLIIFNVSDTTDSISVKIFLNNDKGEEFLDNLQEEDYVILSGDVVYDNYARCQSIMLKSLKKIKKEVRMDEAQEKRIELHLHSKMSAMDGMTDLEKVIKRAHDWGHEAIAITDHGVVQSFPEAMNVSEDLGVKIIYGVEGYLVNDDAQIVSNFNPDKEYDEFTIFDIETTGLSAINDGITEIGAIKVKDGNVIDTFSQLINPEKHIPEFITNLTGITNEMVSDKPKIQEVIKSFDKFIGNSVLVAHNASFDIGFIREKMKKVNMNLTNPVLDTLGLARAVFPNLKNHKLDNLAKYLGISLENHHRAVDDATATKDILLKILEMLEERGIKRFAEINSLNNEGDMFKGESFHIVILAKNLIGLKNLYKLISESHLEYFYRNPRIPKSLLERYREGLIIGSACSSGELYKAILNGKSYSQIRNIVNFYDYLEIQPLDNNKHLIKNQILKDEKQLKDINKRIYNLGHKYNKLVVATGDVHFLDPEDEVYRRILMAGRGFSDADDQPPLYFKTTNEMLNEFSYLGPKRAYEVVVKNTNLINNMIEDIRPIPKGTFSPIIEGSEEELRQISYNKAYEIYGDPLPDIVEKRLKRELDSIIDNGYSVMYIISQKLVWQSLEDGYLVGSRGSVGSSFVATMSGITEVNPLVPHYVCPNCKYSEFFEDGSIASGSDLSDKDCPECSSNLIKDGQDIPFEVFLGFEGDKEPDIDLNFASEYQSKAHRYTEELFGEGYVYRAGTIGTIANKTAYGFVKKYFDSKEVNVNPAEINRLVKGCTGIRRSSGQHPGGVMIVPNYKDIYDFTPIQYPANDKTSGVKTTHFDYNAIEGRILKLDILGHDVPTIIKTLEDITGIDPTTIPLDEPDTMEIFRSTSTLGISEKDIDCKVGSLGIPEFGTRFVRQMLVDTKPNTFSELVRISGLSHGTDVWLNNAQDLIRNNIATLSDVISTREDIMLYLINAGLDKQKAFLIMEKVRKGKGLTEEDEANMRALNLPNWYIESCNKIKYMFPKAHAVAYVMMSFRIAYFKVHYPEAFYATYFTTKAADFDAQLILQGPEKVSSKIKELESLGRDATAKEKNLLTVLEVVREMYARGLKFQNVNLYTSHNDMFIIGEEGILPPLKGLDGVGENAARQIVKEREIGKFISKEDLIRRAKLSKTVIEALTNHGCLNDLPDSDQISLFNV
ncbi:MAG TPA: PolC-type DNA polymerase III [Tissierellaceae bacterium]|nr:PolC-type DNA polymerase III [Tissierellaceae bacterium]